MGHLAIRRADCVVGLEAWQEVLDAQQAAGDRHAAAYTLVELGNVHYLQSAYSLASTCLDASRAQAVELVDRLLQATACQYGGQLALSEGRIPISPAWHGVAERWPAISRQALGERAASAAWEAGWSLPMERLLAELTSS